MIGYIKSHWRGEQSLAYSFWINGVLISGIIRIAINTVDSESEFFSEILPWLLLSISTIGVSIWSWVGIWRAANYSIDLSRPTTPKRPTIWAHAAKFIVILGVLQTVSAWSFLLTDLKTAYDFSKSEVATVFDIEYQGETDVILVGFINKPSVEAIKKAFLEDERRTALQLVSPGGLLIDAYDLADFVENRGILVAAREQCKSACLLVLAASAESYVTPDTRLLFHHPEKGADFVTDEVAIEFGKSVHEYYERFKRYGVPSETLAKLREKGFAAMSIGEAYNANIVDVLWEPINDKFYDLDILCKQVDCFSTPIVLP